jgi:PAS domain S-box-containing protein
MPLRRLAAAAALVCHSSPAWAHGAAEWLSSDIYWGVSSVIAAAVAALLLRRYFGVVRSNRALVATRRRSDEAARALAQSEARYLDIIEDSRLGVQIVARGGGRLFVNQAYVDLAGYDSRDELLNAPPAVFVAPHERERIAGYRRAMLRGEPYPATFEIDAVRKDGASLRVRVFQTGILWKGEEAVQRTLVDLTESKAIEKALRASEKRLRNAQRIVHIGDWQRNYRTNQTVWSDETYRIFGIDPSRQPSFDLFMSLVHPDDRAKVIAATERGRETGEPYALDHRIIRPDGQERIIHEQGEITFDENGSPLTFSGTAQDVTEIRRVERGLARSEARFRSVIETGGAGILLCDEQGRCELVNPELARLIGRSQAECEGSPITDFVDPADAPAFEAAFRALHPDRDSRLETECRLVHSGGDAVWTSLNLTVTRETESGVARYIAIVQDITDRKRAEAELARKTEMLDLARDVAFATNLAPSFEQAVKDCIHRVCTFTGWNIGHAYVRDRHDRRKLVPLDSPYLDDEARFGTFAALTADTEYGEDSGFVGRVILGRGVHWQSSFPHDALKPGRRSPEAVRVGIRLGVGAPVMAGDKIVAVLEFFATESRPRDDALCEVLLQLGTLLGRVYEREQAAETLRGREIQLSQIIDNVPYRIFVKDRNGRFLLVNRAAAGMFRLKPEDMIGHTLRDFYPDKDDVARFAETEREVLETGRTVHTPEERFRDADGRLCYARTIKTPYTTQDGDRAVLGISFDITEEKQHQEQLRRAQRMDALGQMTGGVAHDFNNLLTIILGNLQLLGRRLNDDSLKAMASTAESAAQRGAEVTRRLLAFARSQPLEPSSVALNELVSTITEIMPSSLGIDVGLEVRMADDLWYTLVDPAEMENALLNLVLNARDAMPHGGVITVETQNMPLPDGFSDGHSVLPPGDYAVISVADTGVGMSEEVLARAVEPFFTTKDIGKGSGLGLSMVYGFAQQSGGGVFIDSAPGQGTTVRLYLPRSDEAPETLHEVGLPAPIQGDQETVLLVEDDPDVRAFTATALANLNYRTLEAKDAASALSIIDSDVDVDLLFTDVMLPGGMDGRVLAVEARRRRPSMPVLYTSGNWEIIHPGDGSDWLSNDAILQKPYTQGDLGDMIRAVLNRPGRKGAVS